MSKIGVGGEAEDCRGRLKRVRARGAMDWGFGWK
jgi:hypothetical protein